MNKSLWKKVRAELEEEQLNAMLMVEKTESELKEVDANLVLAEQKASNRQALLRGEQTALRQELDKLVAERQAILATVLAPNWLERMRDCTHKRRVLQWPS